MYEAILKTDAEAPPSVRAARPAATGEGVIDPPTFAALEVDRLFDAVNSAATVVGQAVLYRSLARPLAHRDAILARQEALREIEADVRVRNAVEKLVTDAVPGEGEFYRLLYGRFIGMLGSSGKELDAEGYGYTPYIKGTRFMLDLVAAARTLPAMQSSYLRQLRDRITEFASSRAYALMQGPAYRTEHKILTKAERRWYIPALRFRPTLFKPVLITSLVVFLSLMNYFAPFALGGGSAAALAILSLLSIPAMLVYIPLVGTTDRDAFIYPLRDIFRKSAEVQGVMEALGQLDELLSFYRYRQAFPSPVVLPEIGEADSHELTLVKAKNPILGLTDREYVPNSIELQGNRLTFVTGPNSGGKTAFCKTLAQAQLLAQVGCYVPAVQAALTAADRIFYQVPEISHLEDGEGRFGTELKRTKAIFLATSPRSLVILDELSEGTTFEEKMETSTHILNGFHRIANNTILITHNHELVESFRKKGIGLFRQVEFVGDAPTYRLIEGISRVSHAERVAKRIGFAKEDIEKYSEERGRRRD